MEESSYMYFIILSKFLNDFEDFEDFFSLEKTSQEFDEISKKNNLIGKKQYKINASRFQTMGLSLTTLKAITYKGFKIPTPIQRKTIPLLLKDIDVVAMARTGSGKTAAFVIPMIERLKTHQVKVGSRALILSPNRELALQTFKVVKELKKGTNLKAALLVGGENLEEQFEIMSTNPDIIVATPGRFLHLKVEMDLNLKTIEYVVFDEADRLFEMGFSNQLSEILHYLPVSRQSSLFSATLPKSLIEFAKADLQNPVLVRLDVESMISEDLQTSFFSIKSSEKEAALFYLLHEVIKVPRETQTAINTDSKESNKKNSSKYSYETLLPHSTIIFVSTRHHVEYLAKLLLFSGYSVSYIYGSLDQTARKNQITSFKDGKTSLLVVTDIAARGIDIPLLSNVINYDFPPKPKTFIHRVGRTARAGQKGWAYSLIKVEDSPYLIELQLFLGRKITSSNDQNPDYVQNMVLGTFPRQKLEYYCEWIAHALEDSECSSLRKVMQKGEILYSKTAGLKSPESIRRAKELVKSVEWSLVNPLLAEHTHENIDREALLAKISGYSPHETLFDISKSFKNNSAVNAVYERLRKIKGTKTKTNKMNSIAFLFNKKIDSNRVKDTIITKINNFKTNNINSESKIIQKNKINNYKDEENYLPYYTAISSIQEHVYDVNKPNYSFEKAANNAMFDLLSDDKNFAHQTIARANSIRWSFKKKKLVSRLDSHGISKKELTLVKAENGIKIPATYKTGRYTIWKNSGKTMQQKIKETKNTEDYTTPTNPYTNENKRKYKHHKLQAPKAPDKYRDDYKRKKRRIQEALEKGYGNTRNVKNELRSALEIRRNRKLKEKRKQKNARPSKKKH
ncbi:hypothetical protein PCK1_001156 [Pneumocystis canis]|nr:hypothetical protein PCK1_001156 [Pneumocystis canis]